MIDHGFEGVGLRIDPLPGKDRYGQDFANHEPTMGIHPGHLATNWSIGICR